MAAVRIAALWRERFGVDAPRKIICVGLNYRDHAEEQGAALPEELVAGYTCANDVSARDLQRHDGQWLRAKSFDGFSASVASSRTRRASSRSSPAT